MTSEELCSVCCYAVISFAMPSLFVPHLQGDMQSISGVETGSIDTVLCLSVTKWVHLNGGDAALEALFDRLRDALAPGGLLILEPQPWQSYRKALQKRGVAAELHGTALSELRLRPQMFPEYLSQHGFRLVRELEVPPSTRGFQRPMYLFERLV